MTNSSTPPDPSRRDRRRARWVQLLGLVVAAAGLVGFWLDRDVTRTPLTDGQRELLGVGEGSSVLSFVVAGRDREYYEGASTPVYGADGSIVAWDYSGPRDVDGHRTDTILYVSVVGDVATLIAIPRDLYLEEHEGRVNTVYATDGAEGLRATVARLLGLPVDYYAIINLDVFEHVVDALGGVEVNVPYRMAYVDHAAQLVIDLQPGPQVLDGAEAAGFVRFRETVRGDLDRLDRVKSLAYAMLERLRDLNVRAVGVLPALIESVFADVETNASPALVRELLPHLPRLQLRSATLPTFEKEGSSAAYADTHTVESFLADTFGGVARSWTAAPDAVVHVLDRSGRAGTGAAYVAQLVAMGVPEELLLLSEGSYEPAASRLVVTAPHWVEVDYYVDLLGVGKQQTDRLRAVSGRDVGIQLVLGGDARAPNPEPAAWTDDAAEGDVSVAVPLAP